jgi:hypothetical protein
LAGNFAGLIDGGLGTDSLTITAAGDRVIELGDRVNGNTNVYRVETLTANAGIGIHNELVGDSAAATNVWLLSGTRSGTVNDGTVTTAFYNIDDATGAATIDNVTLAGNFAGLIDGGLGTDSLTITAAGDRIIELGDRVNGNTNVYRVETLTANAATNNELIADNAETNSNVWTISGSNSGRLVSGANSTNFANIQNLTGTGVADSFTISGGALSGVSGVIDGMDGAGTDSMTINATGGRVVELGDRTNANLNVYRIENITARADSTNTLIADSNVAVNTWEVTGGRSGSVSDLVNLTSTSFSNFDVLTGGSTVDNFTVNGYGALTAINAGDGNDYVLVAGSASVGSVELGAGDDVFLITGGTVTGAVSGGVGADSITVKGGEVGSIAMGDGDDTFEITAGAVLGNVNGDAGDDTFTNSGGAIGTMIGGDGTDFIVYTNVVDITLGEDVGGFEGVTAQNNNGTLRARADQTTTWSISGINSGNVSDESESLAFIGFTTLVGGNYADNFNVTGNGSISGLISGGDGADTLSLDLAGRTSSTGQINFDGGGDPNDMITITGPAGVYNETYRVNQSVADLGSFDQLAYTSAASAMNLNYRGVDSVSDDVQANILTLLSTSALNTIQLGANTFAATNSTSGAGVSYAADSKRNITVTAPYVELIDDIALPDTGTLTVAAATQFNPGDWTIAGDSLVLQNVGAIVSSPTGRLNTDVNRLQVLNSGPVYIQEMDDLTLAGLDTSSLLDITAGGSIVSNSSASLISSGVLKLDAVNSIDLSGQNNSLSGELSFTAGSDVSVHNSGLTRLAMVSAQNLTMNVGGDDIIGSGPVTVGGTTHIISAGDVNLTDAANNFNFVNINSAGAVTLRDVNNIAGGDMTAASIDLVTDTGVGGSSTVRLQTHTAKLTINNATSGGVYVHNGKDMQVSITNPGDIALSNEGSVIVERLYANGGDSAQTSGSVSLSAMDHPVLAYTGVGAHSQYTAPDIIGQDLYVETGSADLGSPGRPISLSVNDTFTFYGARGYVYYFNDVRPKHYFGTADLVESAGINSLSGQQLIDIESLGEVDEAVFTAVRNYYYEDVAVMLPADQRMDGSEDEEERERRQAVN